MYAIRSYYAREGAQRNLSGSRRLAHADASQAAALMDTRSGQQQRHDASFLGHVFQDRNNFV